MPDNENQNVPTTSTANPTVLTVEYPRAGLGTFANSLDTFTGKENVKEFFERIEQRAELDSISHSQLLKVVKCKLSGSAYRFFKSESVLSDPSTTYEIFKSSFIKHFTPLKVPGAAQFKLSQIYQRTGETVGQFVTRLKLAGQETLNEDLADASQEQKAGIVKKNTDVILSQFKMGLKRDLLKTIGIVLAMDSDLDIDKATKIAEQEELNQSILNSNRGTVHAVEHYSERETFVTPKQANQKSFPIQTLTSRAVTCFNCYKLGHFARNCQNTVVCRQCKKPGHQEKNCRSASRGVTSFPTQRNAGRYIQTSSGHQTNNWDIPAEKQQSKTANFSLNRQENLNREGTSKTTPRFGGRQN